MDIKLLNTVGKINMTPILIIFKENKCLSE